MAGSSDSGNARWMTVKNGESTPVPPFGVVEVIGVTDDGLQIEIRRPTSANLESGRLLFAGFTGIAANSTGIAHASYPCLVLHEASEGTLAIGDELGTAANSYKLLKGNTGFLAIQATDSGQDVLMASCMGVGDGGGGGGGAGTITVATWDGSTATTIDASMATLRVDTRDGLGLENVSAGVDLLTIADASASQAGIVSTGTQQIAGAKTLSNRLTLQSDLDLLAASLASYAPATPVPGAIYFGGGNRGGTGGGTSVLRGTGGTTAGAGSLWFTAAYGDGSQKRSEIFLGSQDSADGTIELRLYDASGALLSTLLLNANGLYLDNGVYSVSAGPGDSGTDALGNVFNGGICTTVGSGSAGTGTVTSIDVSGGTTGLTFSGGPVATSGTITMAGTLAASNGGTGQTSLAAVNAADFGSGGATDNYVLTADGAGGAAWEVVTGSLDINGLTAAVPDLEDDTLPFYDDSATANRKAILAYHLGHAGGDPGGRLCPGSGDPLGESSSGSGTLYYSPLHNNRIILDDGTALRQCSFSEISLSLSGSGANVYDIWAYWTGSAVALEKLVWSSATARATALALHSTGGFLIKDGDSTRRYLGTIYTKSNACLNSEANRLIWNMYNRSDVNIYVGTWASGSLTWTYGSTTWRIASGVTRNVDIVNGIANGDALTATALVQVIHGASSVIPSIGIGINSTTVNSAKVNARQVTTTGSNQMQLPMTAHYDDMPAIGLTSIYHLERSGSGTVTFASSTTDATYSGEFDSGLTGRWRC